MSAIVKRSLLGRLRGTSGIIDLASIMVGVIVTAIAAGTVAAALLVVLPYTQDEAAKQSLNTVRLAQATAKMNSGAYADYDLLVSADLTKFDAKLDALSGANGTCYVAGVRSASGTIFYTTSQSSAILDNKAGVPDTAWCIDAGYVFTRAGNLATNPSMETAGAVGTVRTNLAAFPTGTGGNRFPYTSLGGATANVSLGTPRVLGSVTYPTARITNTDDLNTRAGVSMMQTFALTAQFTVSVDVFAPVGAILTSQSVAAIARDDPNNDSNAGTFLTPATTPNALIPGQWNRLTWVVTPNAGRTITRVYFSPLHDPVAGDWWEHTRVMVLAGDQRATDYFDGSTTTTNLATNPRASNTTAINSNDGTRYQVTKPVAISGHPLGITTAAKSVPLTDLYTVAASMYNLDGLLNTGPARYLGAWVYVSSPGYRARWFAEPYVAIPGNTWVFLPSQGKLAASTHTNLNIITVSGVAPTTDFAYVTGVVAQESAPVSAFYDAAQQDFSYAWTGAAGSSTSTQKVTGVINALTNASTAVQSGEWSANGSKSLRIVPFGATDTNSFAYLTSGGFTNLISAGVLKPGKQYTVVGTVRLAAPQTGTLRSMSRSILAYDVTNVVTSYSPSAPNAAGQTTVRRTFTVPTTSTNYQLRLYSGATIGGGDVWWDNVMVVEGDYAGSYFDGDSVNWGWTGGAHASTSSGYTVTIP